MRVNENEKKLYLLVDIDDFLVFSSDKLQKIVDTQTNFKTEVLQMLEQLNRNCRYYVNEVAKECSNAEKDGRKPLLRCFPLFDRSWDNCKDYSKPVAFAKYYLDVAGMLLNQFLEERDTFLETDNMIKGGQRIFDYSKEFDTTIKFVELINNNKNAFHKINDFCLREAKYLIEDAQKKNQGGIYTIPEYGALVSMDTNDIIKKGSISDQNTKGEILYKKPIENIEKCIELEDRMYDIITNARVFYTPSKAIVDYSRIHSIENVNWEAVALVRQLIASGKFAGVYFSTHHNGGREEKAKISLMRRILPEANGFIGQRFHDSEHDAKRRGRSSKIIRAAQYLGILPSQIVLLDDSKANCQDCINNGGIAILYKPETDSEKINGRIEETGFNRILDLRLCDVNSFIAQSLRQEKRMVKEK